MAKRAVVKPKPVSHKYHRSSWGMVGLALTLVPLVIGGLLILAWALDLNLFEQPQTQIYVGLLFILLGFGASNALQRNWSLMAAWLLLAGADFILLAWVSLYTQILGFLVGGLGLILLLFEFYKRYQDQRQKQKV
jgi:hypothetical protein